MCVTHLLCTHKTGVKIFEEISYNSKTFFRQRRGGSTEGNADTAITKTLTTNTEANNNINAKCNNNDKCNNKTTNATTKRKVQQQTDK